MEKRILIVEDEGVIAEHLRVTLVEGGYGIAGIFGSVNKAVQHLDKERPFLAIVDIHLQGKLTGIHLAGILNSLNIPFLYLTANCDRVILDAAKATNPHGFVVKPFRPKDLLVAIDIAVYRSEQGRQLSTRRSSAAQRLHCKDAGAGKDAEKGEDLFAGIVGSSPALLEVFELVRQVAPLDTSVMILGESGTGKEGIAAAIHKGSPRRTKPYVRMNCAALPPDLADSELFGHERGAFTGAIEARMGKFEQAQGGTIFLDEIGELPMESQAKLLRVLQDRQIERLGGGRSFDIDVRVIAATNRHLEDMIASGAFRLDLYYRLNVFPIEMSPLRERKEDIPALVSHFIRRYAAKTGKQVTGIDPRALERIKNYPWPGNVRELQNSIERAVATARGELLMEVALPRVMDQESLSSSSDEQRPATMREIERQYLLDALQKCNFRVAGHGGAARYLNLPPSTLYSKLKKLGISTKRVGRGD